MVRKNFYIDVEHNNFLESLKDLTVSEHIRRAISDYIDQKKAQMVSTSPSEKKGGKNA